MSTRGEKGRGGERGSVLILVLAVLAFGAVTIPATLSYGNTGLRAARISKEHLLMQYAADGAVEHSLWRLVNNIDGIIDTLTLENPSTGASVTLNGVQVPTTIAIGLFGGVISGTTPPLPPLPPIEPGNHIEALLNIIPKWVPCSQQVDLFYEVYIRNYGTSQIGVRALSQTLLPSATYVPGTYVGPDAVFTQTWATDHWQLLWDYTTPYPNISSGGTLAIVFAIQLSLENGSYDQFGDGWISYQASGQQQIQLNYVGTTDPVAVGLYDITAAPGNLRVRVNSSVCSSIVKINSYQTD